ncbi:hypothetical protein BVU17_08085 [Haloarcula taiwanensis]|uniref:Sulfatase N-terminal domain-containing protein n=1 Tax=Haloarcula taiwanensis TaxID=1932004 RepID=A0A2H4ZYB7_9EURY|nr:sulfatase [Haloarcula taiwanensis]AUG47476.1 hypothetical protein BVU17_08085 [Haloarcula taiwanensis]
MKPNRPNIVWLTIDSIRADHTSVHGYSRATTQNLSRIANSDDGSAFDNCISEGIWSLPVGTSILTGTYPVYHNTVAEGDMIPEDITTLPELLSEAGYQTYGVSGNPWFSDATDMNRGFGTFEYISKDNLLSAGVGPFLKFVLNLRRHSAGYTLDTGAHCTDFLANAMVKQWIREQDGDEPFFIYAHTEGAHTPYYPPTGHHNRFTDELDMSAKKARTFAKDVGANLHEHMATGLDFSDDESQALIAAYDGLIHYLDSQIGEIFDLLTNSDVGDTILIITSDHGDLLGEMGVLSHKLSTHDGLVRVPLVTHGLDCEKTDSLVQHIDITKELARRAGCDDEQFQGTTPGNREKAIIHRSSDYFEKTKHILSKYGSALETDQFHPSDTHGIRTKTHKLISSNDRTELYELPDEAKDISEHKPDVKARLSNELDSRLREFSRDQNVNSDAELDDDMKDRLSDLGYL